jgi:hypothetical protein
MVDPGRGRADWPRGRITAPGVDTQHESAEVLQDLSSERSLMKKEIEELRTFGLDLRTHLKSYLKDQLSELE